MSVQDNSNLSSDMTRVFGVVKWFDLKKGYGFITITEGEREGQDVFVYFENIDVEDGVYRYLVFGETVSFVLTETKESDKYEWCADNIQGPCGHPLLCLSRHKLKLSVKDKNDNTTTSTTTTQHEYKETKSKSKTPKSLRGGRGRGRGGTRGTGRGRGKGRTEKV